MEFKIINYRINFSVKELKAFSLYELITLLTFCFDNYEFFSCKNFYFLF